MNHFLNTGIFLFAILLFLSSCEIEKKIYIKINDGLETEWEALNAIHPLPRTYGIIYADKKLPGTPNILLRMESRDWNSQGSRGIVEKVFRQKIFVPVLPLWEEKNSVSLEEIQSREIAVKSIDKIRLPEKALPVEGLYPGNTGYLLIRQTAVIIKEEDGTIIPKDLALWIQNIPEPEETPSLLWIGGVGDIMPGEGAADKLAGGPGGAFNDTLPILKNQDLMLGNLEAVATEYDIKTPKSFNYKFPPPLLSQLKEAGFDYFSLTNNHCFDYGERGFKDTIKNLEVYGIPTSGAGLTIEEAVLPWNTEIKDVKVTVMSLAAYPRERNGFDGRKQAMVTENRAGILFDDERGLEALEKAFKPESFNIVMVHGGMERVLEPTDEQVAVYRQFIDRGADLVLGSHPHALQGLEAYREGLIAYSLGNFLFPDEVIYTYATDTAILRLGIYEKRIIYVEIDPVEMNGTSVRIDKRGVGKKRIWELTEKRAVSGPHRVLN